MLLIKTLFQTGARVSEFVNIKTEDVFFEGIVIHDVLLGVVRLWVPPRSEVRCAGANTAGTR